MYEGIVRFLCFVIGAVLCARSLLVADDTLSADMVVLGCGAFLVLMGFSTNRVEVSSSAQTASLAERISASEFPSSAEIDAEVGDILFRGLKVPAIKRYRELAGCGLKDAKEYVEYLEGKQRADRN
jgi:hypothetical protein